MAVLLEGGCRVTGLREGVAEEHGPLRVFRHVDRTTGATAISLRVLELAPGRSPVLANASCDEVLFVIEGQGHVLLDGTAHAVAPETGIYLRPGVTLTLDNPGPTTLTMISSRCPDPGPDVVAEPVGPLTYAPRAGRPAVVHLADLAPEKTADRWYRVLIDDKLGSAQVTQFVGGIPPGRAPDHFHEYEEVLCVLQGQGRMWAGTSKTAVGPGSCIFLPRKQVHCMENTGQGELRLLGVFYPAGSPAVSYTAG
jgi:mannose-6-phosphate isomerase-like protein (cupin superfamily)